ncbi:hypothetical protein [Herbaspirillum sp. ST 5-3]|uniref:hypothetical protein n=1 Tax=Oxalobacteraceae TaxID=75682 RepID=UPI0010A2D7B7|nr:hypothetical protein [Herbaspirillum sp. ST 5-3]
MKEFGQTGMHNTIIIKNIVSHYGVIDSDVAYENPFLSCLSLITEILVNSNVVEVNKAIQSQQGLTEFLIDALDKKIEECDIGLRRLDIFQDLQRALIKFSFENFLISESKKQLAVKI